MSRMILVLATLFVCAITACTINETPVQQSHQALEEDQVPIHPVQQNQSAREETPVSGNTGQEIPRVPEEAQASEDPEQDPTPVTRESNEERTNSSLEDHRQIKSAPEPPKTIILATQDAPHPPCHGINSCQTRNVSHFLIDNLQEPPDPALSQAPEPTLEEYLEEGPRLASLTPSHLAVRGTPDQDSIRCAWRGIARTPDQRDNALRAWLGRDETDTVPDPDYLEALFNAIFQTLNPEHAEIISADFNAMIDGESQEYLFATCFADFTAHEYILGGGSPTITAAYDNMGETADYDLYVLDFIHTSPSGGTIMSRAEHQAQMAQALIQAEEQLGEMLGNQETVLMLAPIGADHRIGFEAWLTILQWDLQEDDEGTVHAIRYGVPQGDPEYSQTLANLKSRITTAAATDGMADDRITNTSGLNQFYRDIGAYDDITPNDGSTDTFTPAQPPTPIDCAGGTAAGTGDRGLLHDCQNLLDAENALAGTATLNWDENTGIDSWDGITTSGTPARVTELDLSAESLTGTIPASLGQIFELTSLDLSNNSLTGAIPSELGWLPNLTELKLSGNSLTGCIPLNLKDVATNDLASLSLLHCQPPAPENLAAGSPGTTTIPISWNSVTGAGKYQIEQRPGIGTEWTTLDQDITASTHTATDLACDTAHQFRVSAYGRGATYQAAWSEPSVPVTARTNPCPPEFQEESYAFSLQDNIAGGGTVGTVTAENADTYSITGGNQDGKFNISNTGILTTASTLDYADNPEYNLTVQADNGQGETSTTEVQVTLSDADCHTGGAVPRPAQNPRLVRDCSALLAAKDTLRGTADLNWAKSRGMSNWTGLELDRNPDLYVKRITLTSQDLDGQITPVLAHLQDLQRLELDDNELTGNIPAELGELASLKQLYLFENRLSGPIPAELGNLENLEVISLYHNQLSGTIPPELGDLTKLEQLLLDGNELTGGIPAEIGNMTSLEHLYLRDNHLTSTIPAELAGLDLEYLFLDGNSLTGCLPAGLSDVDYNDLPDLGLDSCS